MTNVSTAIRLHPAGEFKECTILFSDVVTFTDICSQCEPIHIVSMLNSMYLRFDRLTTVHNVYKVYILVTPTLLPHEPQ